MLDMGFIHDVRRVIAHAAAAQAADAVLLGDHAARGAEARRRASCATRRRSRWRRSSSTAERVEQRVYFVEKRRQAPAARARCSSRPADHARARLHAHQARRQPRRRASRRSAASGRRHPRQQVAERARAGAGALQGGRVARARRDRHRGARHRHRRRHARHQLRPAQRPRDLRAPHRPHRRAPARAASRFHFATRRSDNTCATSND